MRRIILAFNGDLESRLALHWLTHERGYEVIALSINLGQEVNMEALGELALDLGASAAQVIDRRDVFLRHFAWPVLRANAIYQTGCFLGSALARYLIAQELVRAAHVENCTHVAHSAASKGNDQVRMEAAIAAQNPNLKVLAPVREWNLRTLEDKIDYARRWRVEIEKPRGRPISSDRNLWGVSLYVHDLVDAWEDPPPEMYILTRAPEETPDEPAVIIIGFQEGVPCSLNGEPMDPIPLVRELTRLGGEHGIGRSDIIEDRLFGIKSREFYEAPAALLLLLAHRDLESLVQSRDLAQLGDSLSQRYAYLVYMGHWFTDLRRSLQQFFDQTQQFVTGEVRLKLYKGNAAVLGRRSPHGLYDTRIANLSNWDWFDSRWAQGFTSLWSLPARMAARCQPTESPASEEWALP
ncbi:MAG: argininosuccinate synthase [Gemmataceae bacterium]